MVNRNGTTPFTRHGTERKRHRFYASYCKFGYKCLFSLACSSCWSDEVEKVIAKLPTNYTVITRKQSQFTRQDNEQRQEIVKYVLNSMPSTMPEGAAFRHFPPFVRCMCSPDGSNYHMKMHNDNGKCIIESLIITSLGLCTSLNCVYNNIFRCGTKYFRVHKTTHPSHQLQSDQSTYRKTADVVVMAFSTRDEQDAIDYLTLDSPKTPKVLIADTEAAVTSTAITAKVEVLKKQVETYNIEGQDTMGLLVGGNMVVSAVHLSNGVLSEYEPLDGKDLTRPNDLAETAVLLNSYLHDVAAKEMTDAIRASYPLLRSRSASVASFCTELSDVGTLHHYNTRSRGRDQRPP